MKERHGTRWHGLLGAETSVDRSLKRLAVMVED
jgi:hypothetical protein